MGSGEGVGGGGGVGGVGVDGTAAGGYPKAPGEGGACSSDPEVEEP